MMCKGHLVGAGFYPSAESDVKDVDLQIIEAVQEIIDRYTKEI